MATCGVSTVFSEAAQLEMAGYNAAITASSGKWSVALAFFQLIPSKDPVTQQHSFFELKGLAVLSS